MTKAGFILAPIIFVITLVLWIVSVIIARGSDKRSSPRQVPVRSAPVKLKRDK